VQGVISHQMSSFGKNYIKLQSFWRLRSQTFNKKKLEKFES